MTARRLALVGGTPATPDVRALLRELLLEVLPELRPLLAADHQGAELVDVAAVVPLSRRVVFGACRRGEIAGAAKRGRTWIAPRAAVNAWLAAAGPRAVPAGTDDVDDLEEVRASLARPGSRSTKRRAG